MKNETLTILDYIKGLVIGFLISCFIFIFIVALQIGVPTLSTEYTGELVKMQLDLAERIKQPKIVFSSASNTHYGVSCEIIHKETKVDCINGAVPNISMGIDYILYRTRFLLKPGDTVILPIEYELYSNDKNIPESVITYIFAYDFDYVINHPQTFFMISFPRILKGLIGRIKPLKQEPSSTKNWFNQYGDALTNLENKVTPQMREQLQTLKYTKINFSEDSYGVSAIKSFIKWCHQSNIKVLATWPNTIYFDDYQKPESQAAFRQLEAFYQNLNTPILGKPTDFMYEHSLFFDTGYHLHDRGVNQRTYQLLNFLRPYLPPSIQK